MPRLLLKVHHPMADPQPAETVLERNLIGNNVGNLAFSHAAERLLSAPGNDVVAEPTGPWFADPASVDREFDHVVFPLANHFRASNLGALARQAAAIEQIDAPVTVLGVGAQADLSGNAPQEQRDEVDRLTTRFVRAVLRNSPSIGVRGTYTAEYLLGLGFDDDQVDVIGCPSMFLHGPELPLRVPDSIDADGPIGLNISPYVEAMGPVLETNLRLHRRLTYFAQDVHSLRLLLRGTPLAGDDPLLPLRPTDPVFAPGRAVMAVNMPSWMDELAAQQMSFGSRIHGNIVAIVAGTPAVVLAHDSRTQELAQHHAIPFLRLDEHDPRDLTAQAVFEQADFAGMVAGHRERWDTYAAFLAKHGLTHGFGPAGGVEDFDRRVAAVSADPGFPEVARSSGVPSRSRLRSVAARLLRRQGE